MLKFKILLTCIALFACTQFLSARARVPFGKIERIEKVAELPDTDKYLESEGSKNYLDLSRRHEEFNIAWIMPLWTTVEPQLVLSNPNSDKYYELTPEQLKEIATENKLNVEELKKLDFYTQYGGKLVALALLGMMIYGLFSKDKPKKVNPTHV